MAETMRLRIAQLKAQRREIDERPAKEGAKLVSKKRKPPVSQFGFARSNRAVAGRFENTKRRIK